MEKDIYTVEPSFLVQMGIWPMKCAWSVGPILDKFYAEFQNKKIMGVKCSHCGKVYVPPKAICGPCFQDIKDWVEVKQEGVLTNFTAAYVDIHGKDRPEPVVIGIIKLDGADTPVIGKVAIKPQEVKIGQRLKAVWADQRKGALSDLSHFERV